jgi:hypothetical protein
MEGLFMRSWIGAVSLAACVMVGAPAFADTIITITASGPLVSPVPFFGYPDVDTNNYFGLGTDLTGVPATFTYVIDVSQLGTPSTSSGVSDWVYDDPVAEAGSGDSTTSSVPIGIYATVTIHGITVTTGRDRGLLLMTQQVAGEDFLEVITANVPGDFAFRSLNDLYLDTLSNPFLTSLNPVDLAGLILPACNADNGDTMSTGFIVRNPGDFVGARGGLDLCGSNTSFSVTETTGPAPTPIFNTPVPEPMTILIFGSGLLGLGALRRRKTMMV